MQGTYRGAETRAWHRDQWRTIVIPDLTQMEVKPLERLLPRRQDITAIDVGANKGWWTAALLRTFAGQVRHVFMIDASPENFRELTNFHDPLVFDPEEFPLVSAYPYAMSSQPGSVTLHTNDDGSPLASVYAGVTRGWGEGAPQLNKAIQVPADTVDAFMTRQQLERVDVLKVDVEGHEMAVFEGARQALAERRIDVVLFEFGLHQIQSRNYFVDFFDFFAALKYRMFTAENGELAAIPNYSFTYENLSRQFIMYAVAEPVAAEGAAVEPSVFERLKSRLNF